MGTVGAAGAMVAGDARDSLRKESLQSAGDSGARLVQSTNPPPAVRACWDCHSNETRWPWYSSVAPVSWLVQRDVDEGRDELNCPQGDD